MRSLGQKLNHYRLPILAGILFGTSYIPFPPWAIFFCCVPLWIFWLRAKTLKEVFFGGWVALFIGTLIGFNWVAYTVHEFGHLPWVAAIFTLLIFCSFANLHIPLAGCLWWWGLRRFQLPLRKGVWLLPALFWLSEVSFPMIFDWNFGYTWLWARFPAFHLGEWVGFSGLSLITFMMNLPCLFMILEPARRKHYLSALAGIFLALNGLGFWLKSQLPAYDNQLRPLIVQANIGNLEKQMAVSGSNFVPAIINRYTSLTEEHLKKSEKVDFAIWPETAFPERINNRRYISIYVQKLRLFLDKHQLNLITGSYGLREPTLQTTNSVFFLSPKNFFESPFYDKTILLAFGEYLPGSVWLPQLKEWLPEVADFARGSGPEAITFDRFKIGTQICYEGLFGWFTRSLANQGSQILVNVTNDSWYGTWEQPYQHLYMTVARAIEVRRPLIRATNTGISTVALADGTILEKSPMHETWGHVYDVPYWSKPPTTFFMGWGYWLPFWFVVAWILGGALWLKSQLKLPH